MKTKTFKKFTALLVALMLVFSMCVTGISASAAAVSDGTKVVYLKPNSNWTQSSARFAVYVFVGGTNQWVDMSDSDKDGYYSATVPEGEWDKIIFCRMNPGTKENSWETKWNQTSDLDIPDGMNCYTVASGTWDKGGGTWSNFVPGQTPTQGPEPVPDYDYTVAGDEELTGVSWDPTQNPMSDEDGDGIYEITFKNVPAGSHSFKVTDGTWDNCWGNGTSNYDINLSVAADVTITFNSKTKEIKVISDALGDFTFEYMSVVGDGKAGNSFMNGKNWDPTAEENKMTDMGNGVWSITFENVPAGTYEYKFIANGSYTYNWTVEGYFNSSDNSKLTVASNGSTVTLTIDISKYDFKTKEGEVTAKQTVVASDDPSNPVVDPTKPTDVDYYLFGYINGENYGCEEDFENMGDYKFVDGELTVTFDQASYVAVKTTGNASWYMTDGWPGIVNTVTLYNTEKLDATADKLMVPAGEVKFTLVVNDDDTLTLSYEADTVPTIPVETTEPTTEPTEPSTAPTQPTEPSTTPTQPVDPDVPTDGYYVISDSFQLKLSPAGTDKLLGTIALQPGTYQFKLDNKGTLLGYGKTFTDKTSGLTFKNTFKSFCTLNASGGTYTFQVNTDTDTLVVKYDSTLPNEYLIGDLHTILTPVPGKTLSIGSSYLEAGSYTFRLSIGNVEYGYSKVINDTTVGSLSFNSKYKSSCTLIATGGTYTFTLNTATNRLQVGFAPSKDEANDDVHVSGDINFVLNDNGGESNIATGSIKLDEGTYSFKIYNYGVAYTLGERFIDKGTKVLKSSYKSNVTLVASGGTYDFSFNKTTGALTITKK